MKHKAVFLDRDGVINRAIVRDGKPYPPDSLDELEILPDVPAALALLRQAGYRLIVVTNQPDVARGSKAREEVEALHQALRAQLPIDEIRVCFHDDADDCRCRKPKPGLLLDAAKTNGIDLKASVMVGDRWRDIEAGRQAGCTTVFINYNYQERQPATPNVSVRSLTEAAEWIISQQGKPK